MKLKLATLGLWIALAAPAASAQCAMCYQSATGANSQGQKALSKAVVVLLLPPVSFMAVLLTLAGLHHVQRHPDDLDLLIRVNPLWG